MAPDRMVAARAAALFASDLSSHCRPSQANVTAAIRTAIATYGGILGCFGEVAAAFGERPETAVPRMRWARQTIHATYSPAAEPAMATAAASGPVPDRDDLEGTRRIVSSIA